MHFLYPGFVPALDVVRSDINSRPFQVSIFPRYAYGAPILFCVQAPTSFEFGLVSSSMLDGLYRKHQLYFGNMRQSGQVEANQVFQSFIKLI